MLVGVKITTHSTQSYTLGRYEYGRSPLLSPILLQEGPLVRLSAARELRLSTPVTFNSAKC
jgi:hypothetical protein